MRALSSLSYITSIKQLCQVPNKSITTNTKEICTSINMEEILLLHAIATLEL
jgi:hypothetical protein